MSEKEYFQQYMPGDVCFGCGENNPAGLHIHSYWDNDQAICHWQPQDIHQGWAGITCGGIIATLIDCHCMATAMAHAKKLSGQALSAEPHYRFATGMLNIKYLKPTDNQKKLELRAWVTEVKYGRKFSLNCDVYIDGEKTVEANSVAFLVFRSDQPDQANPSFSNDA